MFNSKTKYFISLILFISFYFCGISAGFDEPDTVLQTSKIDEIKFHSQHFEIVGNLYLPKTNQSKKFPLVIWVSGSGPSFRSVKNAETKKFINCFLESGFAYFRIDKPGYGDSKGNLNDDSLFVQLAQVVVDAASKLKDHPEINGNLIGLFGSSQAGYIMPIAAEKSSDIKFIMGSSCPGENSIDQWNYLIEQQMICEGYTPEQAKKNAEMFFTLRTTADKTKFDEALNWFKSNPMIIKSVGYDSTFAESASKWWPREIDYNDQSYFNPMTIVEKLKIPIMMVFGDKDTQIDPMQAMEAYKIVFEKSKNKLNRIELLANTDHNMYLTDTGCLIEISERNKNKNYFYNPDYFKLIKNWLKLVSVN